MILESIMVFRNHEWMQPWNFMPLQPKVQICLQLVGQTRIVKPYRTPGTLDPRDILAVGVRLAWRRFTFGPAGGWVVRPDV